MNRRPLLASAAALAATVALVGCGSGQSAQTYKQRTAADSTNTQLGSLALRNLAITAPPGDALLATGGDAVVRGTFVNEGDQADMLVGATSDAATTVALKAGDAAVPSVAVPPNGLSAGDASIVLQGLTRPLRPGDYVTVTLHFARNGRSDVLVPVQADPNRVRPTPATGETTAP